MVKNVTKRRTGFSKRGSMLTLVLVILAMALIFIASAVMITTSTRTRYYDNVKSSQARVMVTSVAESFCSALATQQITDEDLESMCGESFTVKGPAAPGVNGAGDTETSVTFTKSGNFIYADFSTMIGYKDSGSELRENVRVFLYAPPPVAKKNLFKNMIEVGEEGSFSEFHVGAGGAGKENNTIFCHGDTQLTKNGESKIDSSIIATNRIKLGNGTNAGSGYLLFAGPDAGFASTFNGEVKFSDIFFIAPTGKGKTQPGAPGSNSTIDLYTDNVFLHNFDVTGMLRNNKKEDADADTLHHVHWYDNTSNASVNAGSGTSDLDSFNTYVSGSKSVPGGAAATKMTKMLDEATKRLAADNAFPDSATAQAMFLNNVDASLEDKGELTSGDVEPGKYTFSGDVNGIYEFHCDEGGYVIELTGDVTFTGKNNRFVITGADDVDDSNWPRIILNGHTLLMGNESVEGNGVGIFSTEHEAEWDGEAVGGTKPHCYIYGIDSKFVTQGEGHICDAYIGLYGDDSEISINSKNYLYGRMSATNFKCDAANGTNYKYCPAPDDGVLINKKTPKTSRYSVERFAYYY